MRQTKYQPIIGLEVHIELDTRSKMFCGCPADHFGKEPNTQTCPVCLGLPGALPVPNKLAIDWTIMLGLALNCHINMESKFDRKHYFYPDLPKGYQISQYDQPFCTGGHLYLPSGKIDLERIHLEEDTGKLQHTVIKGKKVSLVDFNRSSVPLVEIVTKPVIHTSDTAKEYAQEVQRMARFLKISDADMEKGSMRLEANISLSQDPNKLPDYKVEVKNLNSFRYLSQAIEFEIDRHAKLLDQGITPDQETRGWSESKNQTISQRSKEEAQDYRYFPEPDIPPVILTHSDIDAIKKQMPLLPQATEKRLTQEFDIRQDYATILTGDPDRAKFALDLLEKSKAKNIEPNTIASYLVNNKTDPNSTTIDTVLEAISKETSKPTVDADQTKAWCQQAIDDNPELVEKYRSGKTSVIGAIIGQVMKLSKGQADPQTTSQIIKIIIDQG